MEEQDYAKDLHGKRVVVVYLTNTEAHVTVEGERKTLAFDYWRRLPSWKQYSTADGTRPA